MFSCVSPTPWTTPPLLVAHSKEALELLDLDQEVTETKEFLDWVAGNKVLQGSVPMAHRCVICHRSNFEIIHSDSLILDMEAISLVTGLTSLVTEELTCWGNILVIKGRGGRYSSRGAGERLTPGLLTAELFSDLLSGDTLC